MTFEEVRNKLTGDGAGSIEEASEMLRVLIGTGKQTPVQIALALNESKRFFTGPRWASWAMETHGLPDEKYAHHRQNVGEMLRRIQALSEDKYALFLEIPISKLDMWTELYNDGVRNPELENPCVPVFNFLKAYPDSPEWKRDKLRKAIVSFLHPEKAYQPELNLKFDALGTALDDDQLSKLTRDENFGSAQAFVMAYNGAKLCSHAVGVIKADSLQFSAEQLEDIEHDLSEARQVIRQLILSKRNTGA
ncbi:MAG: hypothetical protein EOM56_12105 [Deltaproteobacteria bacterium]|nr:hypothetical protein [Deltaproteobacteria bacterium]